MEKLAVWSAFFCKIKGFWCENLRGKLVWKYVPERFEWGKTGFLLGVGKFVWVVVYKMNFKEYKNYKMFQWGIVK